MKTPRIVLLVLAFLAVAGASPALAQAPVGEVAFENSGAPAAQAPFLRGLALLHNFEYRDAIGEFRKAQAADPDFAMAYWGEAMAFNHAVWMEQNAERARAALTKLGPDPQARAAKAGSEREKAYLHALEALYGEGTKEERDFRYADEMAKVHARWPGDVDATAFYALALLGTAHEGRDFAIYMRAAALLEAVYPENRNHPGVLHYLIHSYDDPVHAPLGVRAARLYGQVAPEAGHALHMTSHIFIALGDWPEVIAANQNAQRVVNAQAAARGEPAIPCGHYAEWLVYAQLEAGQPTEARKTLDACKVAASARLADGQPAPRAEPGRSEVLSYTDMAVREAIETGRWREDALLQTQADAWLASAFHAAYGEAIVARRNGERARLARAAARLRELHPALKAELVRQERTGPISALQLMADQVAALEQIDRGDTAGGLAALRKIAETEQALPFEFGPPTPPKPSAELLGDELLKAGDPAGAAAAYRTALARAPGRVLSTAGLQKARAAAGTSATAAKTQPAHVH